MDKKIVLYIACSLDGYIARKTGDVDWLFTDQDYGYSEFYKTIGTIIMGNTTYKQVLSFGDFPYKNTDCFVFSRSQNETRDENVVFVDDDVRHFVENLTLKNNKKIWLLGGGMMINEFLTYDLIDEFIISIQPILLGKGIPLFKENFNEKQLKLLDIKSYDSGLVQVHYQRN